MRILFCRNYFLPLLLTVMLVLPTIVAGAVLHVPSVYPDISQGISAAGPGGTVLVAPGVYTGVVRVVPVRVLRPGSHCRADNRI